MIIRFLEEHKQRKQKELQRKINELTYYITKFFIDLQQIKGSVELPPWTECRNLMIKLKINMDNPKIVNYYYKNLQRYKAEQAIK